jgi:hypothetical protein
LDILVMMEGLLAGRIRRLRDVDRTACCDPMRTGVYA